MQITIITLGTRGDVQPLVALGIGLQAAGHRVRLATHVGFESLVRGHGLDFRPIADSVRDIMDADQRTRQVAASSPVAYVRHFARVGGAAMQRHMSDSWDAAQGADVLMFSITAFSAAYSVAEKLRVPVCLTEYLPLSPTRAFPSALWPLGLRLGGTYNRLTYSVGRLIGWQLYRRAVNWARREVLDLPPSPFLGPYDRLRKSRCPILYGYSPLVVPKPPDWGDWLHVTGYWFLDRPADWQPPAEVVDFLAAGDPPVYVGFGSMNRNSRDRARLAAMVVSALARTGQRGILEMGDLGGAQLPEGVFDLSALPRLAPHDWLFSHVSAVVHHGGAGTTAAGLRAGVPSIIIPFYADQPFWAGCVCAQGAGPEPIPRKRLSVEHLTDAIDAAVGDGALRSRAARLGQRIRSENGVARAVDAFHHHLNTGTMATVCASRS